MRAQKHLLSDSAEWMTNSEVIDKNGNVLRTIGESKIKISGEEITNENWSCIDGKKECSCYKIEKESDLRYRFECNNPSLGKQTGDFNINKNVLFSKFVVSDTSLNGFEIIVKEEDECIVYGTLYDGHELVNSWRTIMVKMQ